MNKPRYFFTKLVLNYSDADTNYKELEDFFYKNVEKEGELILKKIEKKYKQASPKQNNFNNNR